MYAVVFHAHQKIDRAAARLLRELAGPTVFPTGRQIIHFEGKRGPDSTRLKKSATNDQPWHFSNPFDHADDDLDKTIMSHYNLLVGALQKKDKSRAAFEAAWLAHALVDGLTPAHHYPYMQELEDLHGKSPQNMKNLRSKFIVSGESKRESLRRSIKVVGPGGLLTTHTLFEAGAYTMMLPMRLARKVPSKEEIELLQAVGILEYYHMLAKEVGALDLFNRFYRTGWTPKLARQVRKQMVPRMVRLVTLAWYSALKEAEKQR